MKRALAAVAVALAVAAFLVIAGGASNGSAARTYKIAARRQKSTAIHGILTLCTAGAWSPVWIMACAENARILKAQAEVAMYEAGQRRY